MRGRKKETRKNKRKNEKKIRKEEIGNKGNKIEIKRDLEDR